jgi:predicted nucleotidyltransferase
VAVLKELQSVWDSERFIVIGAAAVACHLGLHWRGTLDLDLSVASDLRDYAGDLRGLGWRQELDSQQRWLVPDGSIVDVIPGHPSLVTAGSFTWPDGSGQVNLVGYRLAFTDAVPFQLAAGFTVRIASLPSLVVLKIAAYFDRPWERDSDLADIAHIICEFVGPDAEKRWSNEVLDLDLDFEDVSPFVLGQELRALVDDAERDLVQRFVTAIEDPADRLSTLHRMASGAPAGSRSPDRLRLRLAAFRRGFESTFQEDEPS